MRTSVCSAVRDHTIAAQRADRDVLTGTGNLTETLQVVSSVWHEPEFLHQRLVVQYSMRLTESQEDDGCVRMRRRVTLRFTQPPRSAERVLPFVNGA